MERIKTRRWISSGEMTALSSDWIEVFALSGVAVTFIVSAILLFLELFKEELGEIQAEANFGYFWRSIERNHNV